MSGPWSPDVRTASTDDYEEAVVALVHQLKITPGVEAVLTYGHVAVPGISDVDVVVAMSRRPDARLYERIAAVTVGSPRFAYLWTHMPLVIPIHALARIRWLHTMDNLRLRWGGHVEPGTLDADSTPLVGLANYHDFTLAVHLAMPGERVCASGASRSLRAELMLLHSLSRSLTLGAAITDTDRPAFCEAIAELRRGVHAGTLPAADALREVIRDGRAQLRRMDDHVYRASVARGLVQGGGEARQIQLFDRRVEFLHDADGLEADGENVIRLPHSYRLQFSTYGSARGHLAAYHRSLYGASPAPAAVHPSFATVLMRRLALAEEIFRWQGGSGFQPMVPLGTAYQVPFPWAHRLARIAGRLRAKLRRADASEGP